MSPCSILHFIDFRWINIKVGNYFCFRSKFFRDPCNTIIEARTYGDQKVTFLNCIVCERSAMHTQHVKRGLMLSIDSSQAHQCRYRWEIKVINKFSEFFGCVCRDDSATKINQWFFRMRKVFKKFR